jgi:hypothetical protein
MAGNAGRHLEGSLTAEEREDVSLATDILRKRQNSENLKERLATIGNQLAKLSTSTVRKQYILASGRITQATLVCESKLGFRHRHHGLININALLPPSYSIPYKFVRQIHRND